MSSTLFKLASVPLALIAAASLAVADHRESDYLAEHPKVDGADFYMFRSYEEGREDFVVLIATYQPFQVPFAGPHCYTMDPDACYDFNIDTDGDAVEDIVFRFRFTPRMRETRETIGSGRSQRYLSRPFLNVDPVPPGSPRAFEMGMYETYTIDMIHRSPSGDTTHPLNVHCTHCMYFQKATDYFGDRSFPDYEDHVESRIFDVNFPLTGHGGRVFVGPRLDPAAFDMGEFFDLQGNPLVNRAGARENPLEDFNITAIVLEVPVTALGAVGRTIGAWATASLPQDRSMRSLPEFDGVDDESGALRQVSRVGMPLVSSLFIGLSDKDAYNCAAPRNDLLGFSDYFTHPYLPEMVERYQGYPAPEAFPRYDLEQVYLRGLVGFTETRVPAEMLRFRYDVLPTPALAQSQLGVLGGDMAGFPNGRRPGDDVVDITLRLLMGALLPPAEAPAGNVPFGDGVHVDGTEFRSEFPFLRTPIPGA